MYIHVYIHICRYIYMYICIDIYLCIYVDILPLRAWHAFLICDSHTRQVSFICATFLVYICDMRKVQFSEKMMLCAIKFFSFVSCRLRVTWLVDTCDAHRGGGGLLFGRLSKPSTRRKRTPREAPSTNSLRGVLFLRAPGWDPAKKETPPPPGVGVPCDQSLFIFSEPRQDSSFLQRK